MLGEKFWPNIFSMQHNSTHHVLQLHVLLLLLSNFFWFLGFKVPMHHMLFVICHILDFTLGVSCHMHKHMHWYSFWDYLYCGHKVSSMHMSELYSILNFNSFWEFILGVLCHMHMHWYSFWDYLLYLYIFNTYVWII